MTQELLTALGAGGNAEFGIRNSELRSRLSAQQSDILRRGANDPKLKADRLYPLQISDSEPGHPPTNKAAISYGKSKTLPLHFDASRFARRPTIPNSEFRIPN